MLKQTITGPAVTPTFPLRSSLAWPTCSLLFPLPSPWLECPRENGFQKKKKKAKKSQEKVAWCNPSITNCCSSCGEEHQEGVLKCFYFPDFSSVNHTSPQHSLSTPSLLWLFRLTLAFQWVMVKLPNMKVAGYNFLVLFDNMSTRMYCKGVCWGVDIAAVVQKAN